MGRRARPIEGEGGEEVAEAKNEYYEHIGEPRDDIAAQLKKWAQEIEALEPTA